MACSTEVWNLAKITVSPATGATDLWDLDWSTYFGEFS